MNWKCAVEGCPALAPHFHLIWESFDFPSKSRPGHTHKVEWPRNANAEPTETEIETRQYRCPCEAREFDPVKDCGHIRNMREIHRLNLQYAKLEDK